MQSTESLMSIAVLGKMLFGLLLVLGIMGLLILLMKFLQKKNLSLTGRKGNLKILQTSPLGSKQKLAVVAWGETQYLIALSPSGGFLIDKKPLEKSDLYKKMTGKDA